MSSLTDKNRQQAEERLLASMSVRCKECNSKMRRGRQEGKVYYHCGECDPDRFVWIEMPDFLTAD